MGLFETRRCNTGTFSIKLPIVKPYTNLLLNTVFHDAGKSSAAFKKELKQITISH